MDELYIPLNCWIVFRCIIMSKFDYLFFYWRAFGLFPAWVWHERSCQKHLCGNVLLFLFHQVELPGHSTCTAQTYSFTFHDRTQHCQAVSNMIGLFETANSNIWEFWTHHIFINIRYVKFSHNNRFLVMSLIFICSFLMINNVEHFLVCFIGHFIVSWVIGLFKSLISFYWFVCPL